MNHASNGPTAQAAPSDPQHQEAAQSDFAPTRPDESEAQSSGWWTESADGQCSENAALFAASQPAPLSVV